MSLDTVQDQEYIRLGNSTQWATLTIIVAEFFFTLPDEIRYVWLQKRTVVFYLFHVLKYSTLLAGILNVVTDVSAFGTKKGCYSADMIYFVISFLQDISVAGSLGLRCYAIWNRSIMVSLMIGLLYAAYVATDAIASVGPFTAYVYLGERGCYIYDGHLARTFNPIARYLLATFDTVVFFLTVARTAQSALESRRLHMNQCLSYYILRDGVLYFCFIDALVLSMVVLEIWTEHYIRVNWQLTTVLNILEQCQPTLGALVVQRFMLNLRQVVDKGAASSQLSEYQGQLNFAHGTVLGNIGAPLSTGEDDPDDADMQRYDGSPANAGEGMPVGTNALPDIEGAECK